MLTKETWGILATGIAFVGYAPYIRDILRNKTKPHAFSWFVWLILTVIGFFIQVADNAGPGAWVTGFTAAICFVIFLFSLRKGTVRITHLDWISLGGALIAMFCWLVVKQPLVSVILITCTDALGFFPTVRKTYFHPHSETMSTYVLSGTKHLIALFAMSHLSLITSMYPFYLVFMNGLFVAMLVVRRRGRHSTD